MSIIASSRERRRSAWPLSRRSFGFIVPSCPTEGITTFDSTESSKAKLQAFGPPEPESLQSQNPSRQKIRLPLNGLGVLHGRLIMAAQPRVAGRSDREFAGHASYRTFAQTASGIDVARRSRPCRTSSG